MDVSCSCRLYIVFVMTSLILLVAQIQAGAQAHIVAQTSANAWAQANAQAKARSKSNTQVPTGAQVTTGAQVPSNPSGVKVIKLVSGNCTDNPFYDDDNQVLMYADFVLNTVNIVEPLTKKQYSITLPKETSFMFPINGSQYQFIVSQERELAVLNWNYTAGSYNTTCLITTVDNDRPENRFAGAFPDGSGNIVAGTVGPFSVQNGIPPPLEEGSLFVFNITKPGKASVEVKFTKVRTIRAIAFTADNKMGYLTNSTDAVIQFDYDVGTGDLTNLKYVFNFTENNIPCFPFGLAIDANDFVWVAGYGCGQVFRFDPKTNKVVQTITIPDALFIINVVFGGVNDDELYVATCKFGPNPGKDAGSVFRVTGVAKGFRDNFAVMKSDCTPVYHH